MDIGIRFFAMLRDAAGTERCWLVLTSGSRGTDAKTVLVGRYPKLAGFISSTRLAVNQEYQPWEVLLRDGDELGLIPPVSGG